MLQPQQQPLTNLANSSTCSRSPCCCCSCSCCFCTLCVVNLLSTFLHTDDFASCWLEGEADEDVVGDRERERERRTRIRRRPQAICVAAAGVASAVASLTLPVTLSCHSLSCSHSQFGSNSVTVECAFRSSRRFKCQQESKCNKHH